MKRFLFDLNIKINRKKKTAIYKTANTKRNISCLSDTRCFTANLNTCVRSSWLFQKYINLRPRARFLFTGTFQLGLYKRRISKKCIKLLSNQLVFKNNIFLRDTPDLMYVNIFKIFFSINNMIILKLCVKFIIFVIILMFP